MTCTQQRGVGRRAGDDEVAAVSDVVAGNGGVDFQSVPAHVFLIGFELLVADSPYDHLPAIDDGQQRLDLHSPLDPGAKDPDAFHFLGSQVLGDYRPSRGRAHMSEVGFIQENALQLGSLLAEYQHKAVSRRQAELNVAIEARRYLDDEIVVILDVAVLNVDIAGRVVKEQFPNRRYHDLALGVSDETLFDCRQHIDFLQCLLDLFTIEDLSHAVLSSSPSGGTALSRAYEMLPCPANCIDNHYRPTGPILRSDN